MKNIVLILTLSLLISCASSASFQAFTTEKFTPTKNVDVFTTQKPERPYKEIGKIEVTEGLGGTEDMTKVAIEKAKDVGADAIIQLTESEIVTQVGVTKVGTTDVISSASVKTVVFIAIKYLEKASY